MMALATRYDVRTQVTSSTVAERLPAMCGSDTFTTVVSSTSMKVQNITEMAMIQGLTCLCSDMREDVANKTRGEHLQDSVLRVWERITLRRQPGGAGHCFTNSTLRLARPSLESLDATRVKPGGGDTVLGSERVQY